MKKILILFLISHFSFLISHSQIPGYTKLSGQSGYVTNSLKVGAAAAANASAIFDASSTTKGFLPPRMTTAQRNAIGSPAAGLQIYNSSTAQPNFYNGSSWLGLQTAFTVLNGLDYTSNVLTLGSNMTQANTFLEMSFLNQRFAFIDTSAGADTIAFGNAIGNGTSSLKVKVQNVDVNVDTFQLKGDRVTIYNNSGADSFSSIFGKQKYNLSYYDETNARLTLLQIDTSRYELSITNITTGDAMGHTVNFHGPDGNNYLIATRDTLHYMAGVFNLENGTDVMSELVILNTNTNSNITRVATLYDTITQLPFIHFHVDDSTATSQHINIKNNEVLPLGGVWSMGGLSNRWVGGYFGTVDATNITANGKEINTTAGDVATINAIAGRFRKDASGTTFTLTNSAITANSIIIPTLTTVGLTAGNATPIVVAGSGSAVFTFQSAAGAAEAPNVNADVNFIVIN